MKIRLIWVGKTKEKYAAEGIRLFLSKLMPFAKTEVLEIKEPKGLPTEVAVQKEGRRILEQSSSFVLFDERGKALSSEEFASSLGGRAAADFVLGGPYGVSDEVRRAALEVVSLSRMTMNHELARLVALEQIYRAMMIIKGRGYHH